MKIRVNFYDGRQPVKVDATTAPEALKMVNDSSAFTFIPFSDGYEVIRYLPQEERFAFDSGRTVAQAVETLFTGGHA